MTFYTNVQIMENLKIHDTWDSQVHNFSTGLPFFHYDMIILIVDRNFLTELDDIWLQNCKFFKVPYLIVRSKLDFDIYQNADTEPEVITSYISKSFEENVFSMDCRIKNSQEYRNFEMSVYEKIQKSSKSGNKKKTGIKRFLKGITKKYEKHEKVDVTLLKNMNERKKQIEKIDHDNAELERRLQFILNEFDSDSDMSE